MHRNKEKVIGTVYAYTPLTGIKSLTYIVIQLKGKTRRNAQQRRKLSSEEEGIGGVKKLAFRIHEDSRADCRCGRYAIGMFQPARWCVPTKTLGRCTAICDRLKVLRRTR